MHRTVRRTLTTAGTTAGAFAALTGTALASTCYLATPAPNAPRSDAWYVAVIADVVGYECPAQRDAGNAALRAEGLPLSLRVKADRHLAAKAPEQASANGKGMESFDYGEPDFTRIAGTYAEAAFAVSCS